MGFMHYVFVLEGDSVNPVRDNFTCDSKTGCWLAGYAIPEEKGVPATYIGRKNVVYVDRDDNHGMPPDSDILFRNKFSGAEGFESLDGNRHFLVGEALNTYPHREKSVLVYRDMLAPLKAACGLKEDEVRSMIKEIGFITEMSGSYRSEDFMLPFFNQALDTLYSQ